MQAMSSRNVDRISGLPDELLIHILSLVTTRQAVQMSLLLSKRWSHLWTSLPSLHFCESEFSEVEEGENVSPRFLRFIDEVLNSQRKNNNITKFHFSACNFIDANILWKWILLALRGRNVQELTIESGIWDENFERIKLPRSLFACRSLRVLKLVMGVFPNVNAIYLELPTTLCDLRLKSLHLEGVVFDELSRLISYCPFLEDLYLSNLHCHDLKISSHSLEKLTIDDSFVATIEVSAPRLLSFNFENSVEDCVLKNLVSLVEADIKISDRSSPKFNYVLKRILEGISNVSSLTLTCDDVHIQRQDFPVDLPMFEKLSYLKLNNCFDMNNMIRTYILEHSPNFKTGHIQ